MKPQAIEQAEIRLARAAEVLPRLKDDTWEFRILDSPPAGWSQEDANASLDFSQEREMWERFLTAASGIYSKLEQGSKGEAQSVAWFRQVKRFRKDDELLSYIHHARNSEEHALEISSKGRGVAAFGSGQDRVGEGNVIGIKDGEDVGKILANLDAPRLRVVAVTDERYGDKFLPPKSHLNKPVESDDPYEIAILAYAYLDQLIKDARALPVH